MRETARLSLANTGLNEVNLRKSCDEWPGTDKVLSLGKQNVSGEAAKIESRLSLASEDMNVVVCLVCKMLPGPRFKE